MKKPLKDIKFEYDQPIPTYRDNTSAISVSKNPVIHSKPKHIPIKYNFLREHADERYVKMVYVNTKEHIGDISTKPLPREVFEYLRLKLGVTSQY